MKKNTIINAWRYAALAVIAMLFFILLLSTPTENCSLAAYLWALVWTKCAAGVLLFALCTLVKHWDNGGYLEWLKHLFEEKS